MWRLKFLKQELEVKKTAQKKDCPLMCSFWPIYGNSSVWKIHQKGRKKNCQKNNHLIGNFMSSLAQKERYNLLPEIVLSSGSGSFGMAQTHRHTNKYTNMADSRRNPPRGPIRWKQLRWRKFSLGWLHTWLSQLMNGITKVFI